MPRQSFIVGEEDKGKRNLVIRIGETVSTLTKCSFDQRYREPIISLGGIEALAELVQVSPEGSA